MFKLEITQKMLIRYEKNNTNQSVLSFPLSISFILPTLFSFLLSLSFSLALFHFSLACPLSFSPAFFLSPILAHSFSLLQAPTHSLSLSFYFIMPCSLLISLSLLPFFVTLSFCLLLFNTYLKHFTNESC